MRGTPEGMATPYPVVSLMPAIYQEDPFARRFTAGFDDVLAPLIATLDCLDAYVDPLLAPEDFLEWIAGWLGLQLDETTTAYRRRVLVAEAVELYLIRGTLPGLQSQVEILTGGRVEIADNGGVRTSQVPGAPLPGEDTPRVALRVHVADPSAVGLAALDASVAQVKPAHVLHSIEVVGE